MMRQNFLSGGGTTGSLSEWAYLQIRENILSRQFRAGDTLTENSLAKLLGISLTPVRDALRQLHAEGLCMSTPGKRIMVTRLSPQSVLERYAVQEVLDAAAAKAAALHARQFEVASLRQQVAQQRAAAGDAELLAQLNRLFHQTAHQLSRNTFLVELMESVQVFMFLLDNDEYDVRWPRHSGARRA
jgi:DNA-binding GntR family transcriptional regulator